MLSIKNVFTIREGRKEEWAEAAESKEKIRKELDDQIARSKEGLEPVLKRVVDGQHNARDMYVVLTFILENLVPQLKDYAWFTNEEVSSIGNAADDALYRFCDYVRVARSNAEHNARWRASHPDYKPDPSEPPDPVGTGDFEWSSLKRNSRENTYRNED